MTFILQPWHILFAVLCGRVNERQQNVIEFQNAQIDALLNKLVKKRLLLSDDQRRVLAVKAHVLGRKAPFGSVDRGPFFPTTLDTSRLENQAGRQVSDLGPYSQTDATGTAEGELSALAHSWSQLPSNLRAAILQMVQNWVRAGLDLPQEAEGTASIPECPSAPAT